MHANIVVGLLLVALVAQAALSLRLMRLRTRLGRVEAKELELFRTVAAVQGWAAQEICALQGAVTVREPALPRPLKPEAEAEAERESEEQRATLATPARLEVVQKLQHGDDKPGEDSEATTVFEPEALRHALRPPPWVGAAPEEEEPARHERGAMFVTAFHPPEKEGSTWAR